MKRQTYLTQGTNNNTLNKVSALLGSVIARAGLSLIFVIGFCTISFSQTQTFNASSTWVCPAGVTTVSASCWGAGGGGNTVSTNGTRGAGGGGGAFANSSTTVVPGTSYTVNVGTGGSANVAGGDSWFISNATVMAKGGGAANNSTNAAGAGGSSANSIGTVKASGGNGATSSSGNSGGGGGAAGLGTGAGLAGGNATGATGGTGNSGIIGNAGTGASGVGSASNGSNGVNFGGGGGGGYSNNTTPRTGGSGAGGYVSLAWACPTYSLTSTSASTVCLGAATIITLTGSSAGLPVGTYTVTYNLSGANSATASTASMTVSSAGSGSFSIGSLANAGATTFTITNLKSGGTPGCSTNLSINNTFNITVNTFPSAPTAAVGTSICGSGTATISATPATSSTIDWYAASTSGSVLIGGTGVNSFTTPSISTTTTYYAQSRNSTTGCISATRLAVTAIVNSLPTLSANTGGASIVCVNGTTPAFTNAQSAGIWSIVNGTGSATISSGGVVTGVAAGTATVVYTYSNGTCSNSVSTSITVVAAPITSTISYPSFSYCFGAIGSISPTVTGVTNGTFSSNPAGLSINGTSGIIDLGTSAVGNYTITYTYSNASCSATATFSLSIVSLPPISCPANMATCLTASPFALTSASPQGGVYSGTGVSGSGSNYTFSPATAGIGTHTIAYTYGSGACSSSCIFTITVTNGGPSVSAVPSNNYVYSGNFVNIALSSSATGTQFTWTASCNNPSITGFSSQNTPTTGPINQQLFNTSPNVGEITYNITPALVGCSGTPIAVVITMPSITFCESPGTFQKGSCIIDMGIVPQTYANAIKPYGLVYQLLNTYKVPVYWAINPNKTFENTTTKVDQADFVVDGYTFKGGSFIVPAGYLSAVQSEIDSWVAQGVQVRYSNSGFAPPIYELLTRVPKVVLDIATGSLVETGFYARAGIPTSAYTKGGIPSAITNCDDIYVLPHAEPQLWTAAQKDSLRNFINQRGWFFSSCYAVSFIENMPGMNFLSNSGLVPYNQHGNPSIPYNYSLGSGVDASNVAADPFMQFMGKLDGSINSDAAYEKIYVPKAGAGGGWRPTTKVSVYKANFSNTTGGITTIYPDNAAILTYGRAFGDPNKGLVMYLSGHDFESGPTVADNVAKARVYASFLLRSGAGTRPRINPVSIPSSVNSGETIALSVSVPPSTSTIVSMEWTSDLNGIFSEPNATNTNFTAPTVDVSTICTVQFRVTDACGRYGLFCTSIVVNPTIKNNYIGASQTICTGSVPVTLTGSVPVPPAGSTSFTYQWVMSTTSSSTGFVSASGVNNTKDYTPPALNQTTWFRRQIVSGGITVSSTPIQILVVTGPSISAQPSTLVQDRCQGDALNALSVASADANITYQWFSNSASSNSGGSSIASANNAVYTPSSALMGTLYYYCVITGSNGCSANSNVSGAVNIGAGLNFSAQPFNRDTAACSFNLSVSATGGGLAFQWYSSSTSNASTSGTWTQIAGATSSTYSPLPNTSLWYYCRISGGCPSPTLRKSNASGLITILPSPTASIVNNSGITELTCTNAAINLTAVGSGGSGSYSDYSWAGPALVSGATASLTVPGNYTATITASNGCKASANISITSNTNPPLVGIVNNTGITNLDCANKIINVTATGGQSYNWNGGLGTSTSMDISTPGTFIVTGTGSNGCTASKSIVITKDSIDSKWLGAVSSDWFNEENWCGDRPNQNSNVLIPAGAPNMPAINFNAEYTAKVKNITLESGTSILVSGNTFKVYGNIFSNGILNAANGALEFAGISAQSISGSMFTARTLKNLVISNAVGLNVSNAANDTLKISESISFGNVNGSVLNTGNNITLLSSATQTASVNDITNNGTNFNNSISGKVTIERYIPARRAWRLMTVPFLSVGAQTLNQAWQEGVVNTDYVAANNKNPNPGYGMHISGASAALGFDPTPNNNPSVKIYNATADTLTGIANTTSIKVTDANAFMVFVRGDRSTQLSAGINAALTSTVLRANGNLKTGSQVFNFAPQLSSTRVINNLPVWSVVGNPFASSIDLTKVSATGDMSINAVSVWDPNLTGALSVGAFQALVKTADAVTGEVYYLAVPGGGSYGGSFSPVKTIQSGQAFLVQRSGKTSGSITINENAKTTQSAASAFRPSRLPVLQALCASLYFQNTDSTYTILDGNAMMFNEEYLDAVDINDVAKLKNMSENFAIIKDNQTLIVEKRTPIVDVDTISYNLSQLKVRNYQFKIEPRNLQLQSGMEAFLEDSFNHASVLIDLQQPTYYNFSVINSPESYNARRFRIVFKKQLHGILPVTFRNVIAYRQQEKIKVDWKVENESDVLKYEIEKSVDGIRFNAIAVVANVTNGGRSAEYSSADLNPTQGLNYYRIKSVDVNGRVLYTQVVKVIFEVKKSQISIYPNPIQNGIVNLFLENQLSGVYHIRLLNMAGQVIAQQKISHIEQGSKHSFEFDMHIPSGNYQIEVMTPAGKRNMISVVY